MTSRASCYNYNRALLRKNITRFFPLWGMYFLILLLLLSVSVRSNINMYDSLYEDVYSTNALVQAAIVNNYTLIGLYVGIIYAPLCAAAGFGLMHKTRSAYMLAAFPISRREMFGTGALTGLIFGLVPLFTVAGLCSLMCLSSGAAALGGVWLGTLIIAIEFSIFFFLAVFAMQLTGKMFAAAGVYVLLNCAFMIIEALGGMIIEPLLTGITNRDYLSKYLTPAWLLNEAVTVKSGYDTAGNLTRVVDIAWPEVLILLAVCLALFYLGWQLYRHRRMEMSGELVVFRAAQPVCRVLLSVLAALFVCVILTSMIDIYAQPDTTSGFIFSCIYLSIGAFLGWFGAEMLLKKSLRVFRGRSFVGLGVVFAVLVALLGCFRADAFGIVHKVPEPDEVKSVQVRLGSERYTLNEREDIEKLLKIHAALIDEQELSDDEDYTGSYYCRLIYTLKDDSTIERRYRVLPYAKSETMRQCAMDLRALCDDPNTIYKSLMEINLPETEEIIVWFDATEQYWTLEKSEISGLVNAILEDVLAGNTQGLFDGGSSEDYNILLYIWQEDSHSQIAQELYITPEQTTSYEILQDLLAKYADKGTPLPTEPARIN